MEGRQKPPKAEHPFPDKVELWKLWGTPSAKAFFKSYLIFYTGFVVFSLTWLSIREKGRGPFGIDLKSDEEVKKALEISKVHLPIWNLSIVKPNVQPPHKALDAMFFDDGRQFVPAGHDRLPVIPDNTSD